MKKVLLAIDGIDPNKKILDYAVELCKRIRAELNILQVIDRRIYKDYLKKMQKGLSAASKYFDSSMVAITFAEAGDHKTAIELMPDALNNIKSMLPENQKDKIGYNLKMTGGNSGQEIIDYVEKNRDVVMAIYDPATEFQNKNEERFKSSEKRNNAISKKIQRKLSIPLVVIGSSK
ncbi:MAG: universal stress protein [Deltaproteobacteria bacterium]|nr:universal stress protein [Deltaproteobacteria bacterium]MBW1848807.1 universal stress protein [Deltaproteobacteria bacterium]